ncbi:NADH-quinone oxidoreductase subunit D 1 [Folsomia candida]|uniref:NADH-quinone oxidoreductase subunit D 1 n=1 Tax=Folsomia candida TaxID=158441 RepID=A0A226F4R6_FOLCA|nr:NADH-quinone oxidoreductase subunit D 1 [Folsomia candida]
MTVGTRSNDENVEILAWKLFRARISEITIISTHNDPAAVDIHHRFSSSSTSNPIPLSLHSISDSGPSRKALSSSSTSPTVFPNFRIFHSSFQIPAPHTFQCTAPLGCYGWEKSDSPSLDQKGFGSDSWKQSFGNVSVPAVLFCSRSCARILHDQVGR